MKKACFCSIIFLLCSLLSILYAQPKNIILFIGDGMGFEQIKAAEYYAGESMVFDSFPYQGQVTTYSANSSITDSAAAATAIATGTKVNNGVISVKLPGDGSELPTLLEYFKSKGKTTGLVTTTYPTHATPAGFGAHDSSRSNYSAIGQDILYQTQPNVLFGGGENGISVAAASSAGYNVVDTFSAFSDAVNNSSYTSYFAGLFGGGYLPFKYDYRTSSYPYPDLSQMTVASINALRDDPDGFFLMVEGGQIDTACHSSDIQRCIYEALDFNKAVESAYNLYSMDADTLILVTADHETGGLVVVNNAGVGVFPLVTWSGSGGHTAANVPIFAWGHNAQLVSGTINNTDIWNICTYDDTATLPSPILNPYPSANAIDIPTSVVLSWTAGEGSTSHNVYFGQNTLEYIGQQSSTLYSPGLLAYDTIYQWRVDEVNSGGTTIGPLLTFKTGPMPSSVVITASSDIPSLGTISETYAMMEVSDNLYESITEVINPPNRKGFSTLQHTWAFNIPQSTSVKLDVEAFHSPSADNDNFVFEYSVDGVSFQYLLTVYKTIDDGCLQSMKLPDNLGGTIYIRVKDTDYTKGSNSLDILFIDYLSLTCSNQPSICVVSSMEYTVSTSTISGDRGSLYGLAIVTVRNNCGDPMGDVFVSGKFVGDFSESFSDVKTDLNGQAIFKTSAQLKRPSFGFVVNYIEL